MPDKFDRPINTSDALYHDVLCGRLHLGQKAIFKSPQRVAGKAVIDGAWSHGATKFAAQDDVIACLWIIIDHESRFEPCQVLTSIDENTIGILYEGSQSDLVFQKILLSELIRP